MHDFRMRNVCCRMPVRHVFPASRSAAAAPSCQSAAASASSCRLCGGQYKRTGAGRRTEEAWCQGRHWAVGGALRWLVNRRGFPRWDEKGMESGRRRERRRERALSWHASLHGHLTSAYTQHTRYSDSLISMYVKINKPYYVVTCPILDPDWLLGFMLQ